MDDLSSIADRASMDDLGPVKDDVVESREDLVPLPFVDLPSMDAVVSGSVSMEDRVLQEDLDPGDPRHSRPFELPLFETCFCLHGMNILQNVRRNAEPKNRPNSALSAHLLFKF